VKHRKLGVFVGALLVLVVFGAVAFVFLTRNDSSNVITRTVRGEGGGSDANTLAIYAPSELSKPLERVTTAFQQENPGTTFQFTLGPSSELAKRIQNGQKPSIYIDATAGVAFVSAKARPTAAPVAFGNDIAQIAVAKGNPRQVDGLGAFGSGSPLNSGICSPQLLCGRADAEVLQHAGVNAAPKVVTNNIGELTDGVAHGRIDAVLLMRSDLRSVLTSISTLQTPPEASYRVEYQMAQYKTGGPTDQFIQWLQGSPNARHVLRFAGMLSFYDA
jgi:molybdate transport system substrate-binding protein